ncbi:MAG: CPBP family intramembrane metalloprotease [Bacteroidetes bacterium]|nr:CPBP family intramembrane metalloprotease [Bacteroidota bacterium]
MQSGLISAFGSIRDASPGKAFLYLIFFIAIGLSLSSVLNLAFLIVVYGLSQAEIASMMGNPGETGNMRLLMISQLITSIGVFIAPAWLFIKLRFNRNVPSKIPATFVFKALLISVVVILVQAPLINFTALLNETLNVSFISESLQQWMVQTEADAKVLTEAFLKMDSLSDLLFALLVMAAIPAIGEELLFRAAILPLLLQAGAGKHLAVWLTAFLFSFIHFQFFGFLPRFLLGALLGYLFIEGGSVIYPIMAHFANNALAVISSWPAFAGMDSPDWFSSFPSALVSAAFAAAGIFLLRRMKNRALKSAKFEFGG